MEDLTIRAINGKQYVVQVNPNTTVLEIKQALYSRVDLLPEHLNVPPERQRLVNCGQPLEDDSTVDDEFLLDQTVVTWIIRPGRSVVTTGAIANSVEIRYRVGLNSAGVIYSAVLNSDWTIQRAIEELRKAHRLAGSLFFLVMLCMAG